MESWKRIEPRRIPINNFNNLEIFIEGKELASLSIQSTVTNYNKNNQNVQTTFPSSFGSPSINLWFPNDLSQGSNNPAFIMFQFYQYQRPSIYIAPNLSSLGNVILPMPTDLVDRVQLTYDQREMGSVIGAALDSFASVGAAKGSISGTLSAVADHAATVVEGIGLGAASGAISTLSKIPGLSGAGNIISGGLQFLGYAQNPFLSVLFSAPQFKRFGMTWTFIPETPSDSSTLDFILRKFKYHALPDIAAGGLFFSYPDIVVPTIFPQNYFFDFKQCVLENVVVNYVPGNTPSLYSGSLAPTAIQFTITLLEIALWYKGDMQSGGSGAPATYTQSTNPGFTGSSPATTQPSRPVTPTPPSSQPSRPVTPTPGLNGGGDPLGSSLTIDPNGPSEFSSP